MQIQHNSHQYGPFIWKFIKGLLFSHSITQGMIVIQVKENESIDKALKRFKKKFEKTGVLRELRSRTYFTKPSISRRGTVLRAAYRQKMILEEGNS